MSPMQVESAVFTKPWMTQPLAELGRMVKGIGFDAVELPVRPGFQMTPKQVAQDLLRAARELFA